MFFPFWTCYLVRWPYSVYFTHFVYWNGLYFERLKGNTLAHMTNLSHRRACRKKQGTYRLEMLAINNSPETLCTSSSQNRLLFYGRNTNFTFGLNGKDKERNLPKLLPLDLLRSARLPVRQSRWLSISQLTSRFSEIIASRTWFFPWSHFVDLRLVRQPW